MPEIPRKILVELSIDAELLRQAERAGTDLAEAAEGGIRRSINEMDTIESSTRRVAWQAENAEAIRSSNEYVRKNGLPLAKYRLF